jgi:hypothetical protein
MEALSVSDSASNAGPITEVAADSVVVSRLPENSVLPEISGDPVTGSTMSASEGSWSNSPDLSYQWQISDDGVNDWRAAGGLGVYSSSYVIDNLEVGQYLRVLVTATNASGSAEAASASSAPISSLPENVSLPELSGAPGIGSTLAATTGSWTGTPTPSYAYQWIVCDVDGSGCQDITGDTTSAYVIDIADAGYRIGVRVTASNAAGSSSVASSLSGEIVAPDTAAPVLSRSISIVAEPAAGQEVVSDGGHWVGSPSPAIDYQWQLCPVGGDCSDIDGANALSYTPLASQFGQRLRLRVTATNDSGTVVENSAFSGGIRTPPALVSTPAFSGAAAIGGVIISSAGTWRAYPEPNITYRWKLCDNAGENCNDINGATGPSYRATSSQVGRRLRVRITATNALGSDTTTSSFSGMVQGVPVNTTLPNLSGSATSGQSITVNDGSWVSYPDPSYTYQWQRCDAAVKRCSNVSGAQSANYLVSDLDAGNRLRARVTATNTRGFSVVYSDASNLVASAPVFISGLTVSGKAILGLSLAAVTGKWSGSPAPSYVYQWQRCDNDGSNCADITGATRSSYSLIRADYNKRIRVAIAATNSSGSSLVRSGLTAIISSAPLLQTPPEITGDPQMGETLTVDAGQWQSTSVPEYKFQWQRCDSHGKNCQNIKKATSDHLTLTAAQVGGTVSADIISSNPVGKSTAEADVTDTVEGRPVTVSAPVLSGKTETHATLTSTAGSWSALPGASFTYQWQRCRGSDCTDIADATDNTYVLSRADAGLRIRSSVTATNPLGAATATSAISQQVKIAVYSLNLNAGVGGVIKIAGSQGDCRGICKVSITEGTNVKLTASAITGYIFANFADGCSGSSCEFTMERNMTVSARFPASPRLSVNMSLNKEEIVPREEVTVNLEVNVINPTEEINAVNGLLVCITIPDTLMVPSIPAGATLINKKLCWNLGTVTPPYTHTLSVNLKALNRLGQRTLAPMVTAISRETVNGKISSGTGMIRVKKAG